jgi:hypothetical protein
MLSKDRLTEEYRVSCDIPSWATPQQLQGIEDGENLGRRRQSVECTALTTRIVETKQLKNSSGSYTVYVVEVSSGIKSWSIERRFSDFYHLDQQLRKNNPGIEFPPLPPKKLFGSSTSKVVDSRKETLESYLQKIVRISKIWNRSDIVQFLDNDNNTMTFLWNFERMRRTQEVNKVYNGCLRL